MTDPLDMEEFRIRFHENQLATCCFLQRGLGMPCPFCAAPNFTRYAIFEVADTEHKVQTCWSCKRSGKYSMERYELQGNPAMKFFVLQTGGPPQPDWLRSFERIGWMQ